jgi:hypothetical protein
MNYISIEIIPLQVDVIDLPRPYARAILLQLAITSVGQIVGYDISLPLNSEYEIVYGKHQVYRDSVLNFHKNISKTIVLYSSTKIATKDALSLFQYFFYDWPPSVVGAKQNLFTTNIRNLVCRIETSIGVANDWHTKISADMKCHSTVPRRIY